MKILFIGNANLKVAARSHFAYNTRIFNGLIRNGHYVYFFSDRDEVRRASPFGIKGIGRIRANHRLLDIVKDFRPHAIIISHVNLIDSETFRLIKERHPEIRIGRINVDALFTPNNHANLLNYSNHIDATFITTGGPALSTYAHEKHPFYFIPNITDSSIDTGHAFEYERLHYDLACFMHNDNSWDERTRLNTANGVATALPELKICYRGFNKQPNIRGHEYIDFLQNSAMALNLSRMMVDGMQSTEETRYLYSSDRIAHIMGNGVLGFTSDKFSLNHLYSDKEVVFFSELGDLIEKVRFYKQNPAARQEIAKAGWKRAHRDFNEATVIKYVLERLMDKPLSQEYSWPTTAWR
jgi:hypothetical protein